MSSNSVANQKYNVEWRQVKNKWFLIGPHVNAGWQSVFIKTHFATISIRNKQFQVTCMATQFNPHWLIKKENGHLTKQQTYDTIEQAKGFAEQFLADAIITNK